MDSQAASSQAAPPAPAAPPTPAAPSAPSTASDITWDIAVPLINNRVVMGGIVRVWGIAVLLISVLLTVALGAQGEWDVIPKLLLGMAIGGTGLIALSVAVMVLIFRNKMLFRFTLSDTGILFETIDTTVRAVNRVAMVAGVLGGSAQTAGTGLIAQGQETQEVLWAGNFRAEFRPRARVIVLRNAWRALMYVYCTPENYDLVAERVRSSMAASATETRVARRSPVPRYVGYSALVVVASLPLFALSDAFDVSLLAPLLVMCFGLAMVWLIGLFGYVVMGTLIYIAAVVAMDALGTQSSFFEPGVTFARWTVYSGDDWALLTIAGIGAAALIWLSVRMVRGRMPSMLAADEGDMAGE
jgi:hypothetical protein